MRTLAFAALSLSVPGIALAFGGTSKVENVEFIAQARVFNGVDYEIPLIGFDMGSTRIEGSVTVDLSADVYVDQTAHSEVTWPTALTQRWLGVTQGVSVGVEGAAALNVTLQIGNATINYPVLTRDIQGGKKFTSLLLPQGPQNVVAIDTEMLGDPFEIRLRLDDIPALGFQVDAPFWDNWEVYLVGSIDPTPDLTVTGERVDSNMVSIDRHNGTGILALPTAHNGKAPVESVWHGLVEGTFSLKFNLGIEAYTWNDGESKPASPNLELSFQVYEFDFSSTETKFASEPANFDHPLPAIGLPSQVDFGSNVEVGTPVQREIPITNIGAIGLEGEYTYTGDGSFRIVGNNSFYIGGNNSSVAQMEFLPSDVGNFAGRLTFESNDPKLPSIEVPVFGTAVPVGYDPNDPGDGSGGLETRGCGCDSTPGGAPASLMGLALLSLALRRRRQG